MNAQSWFATSVTLLLSFPLASCGGGGGGGDGDPGRGGTLYFSQDLNANGLFILDTETGAATPVGAGATNASGGNVGLTEGPSTSILWGTTKDDIALASTDGSGATTLAGSEGAEGLAFHAPDGLLYGTEDGSFFTIHPVTGLLVEALESPGEDLEGLASDPDTDTIFAIGDTTVLFAYDVASGTWSPVGDTGINWDSGGLAYDASSRTLYAVGEGGGDDLYRIDPDTAQATLVGPTGLSTTTGGLGFVPDP